MSKRVPALVLYARRVPGVRGALVETLGNALGAVPDLEQQEARGLGRLLHVLDRNSYASLSYVVDWLDAFRRAPALDATCCNIVNLLEWPRARREIRTASLIIVLHSAAGDDLNLISRLASSLCGRRGRLLVFFGNEYTQMPAKIAFAKATAADFIASQLPPAAAAWLYQECSSARILHAPAALNGARYHPLPIERTIDIGFRGDLYPFSIGDDERTRILEHFRTHAADYGLSADIRYEREAGARWNEFMCRCHGIVGAESGTYFLERDDSTEKAVRDYLARRPEASFAEIRARFFDAHPAVVSGKAISSRHFEAIGSKTCQILLEGHYNGVLVPDVHYFSVRRDLSGVEEVIDRFKDPAERGRVAEGAYAHVMAAHSYDHRVAELVTAAVG